MNIPLNQLLPPETMFPFLNNNTYFVHPTFNNKKDIKDTKDTKDTKDKNYKNYTNNMNNNNNIIPDWYSLLPPEPIIYNNPKKMFYIPFCRINEENDGCITYIPVEKDQNFNNKSIIILDKKEENELINKKYFMKWIKNEVNKINNYHLKPFTN